MTPNLSNSVTTASELLGCKLVHETSGGRISGYIVETEAYDMSDPASHTFGGLTNRNAPMFEEKGTIYVYFTYGMHYCVNIVTGEKGRGQAVLIRALEPLEGINLMELNRSVIKKEQLTNGPAKLTEALGINKSLNGTNLTDGPLHIEPGFMPEKIIQTTRVGIKKAVDQPWRFYIANSPYVSKR